MMFSFTSQTFSRLLTEVFVMIIIINDEGNIVYSLSDGFTYAYLIHYNFIWNGENRLFSCLYLQWGRVYRCSLLVLGLSVIENSETKGTKGFWLIAFCLSIASCSLDFWIMFTHHSRCKWSTNRKEGETEAAYSSPWCSSSSISVARLLGGCHSIWCDYLHWQSGKNHYGDMLANAKMWTTYVNLMFLVFTF